MAIRVKRCPTCLRQNVPREDRICGSCGHRFAFHPPPPPLIPPDLPGPARWVEPAPHDISCAALASLFVIGAGQMYNHQQVKGMIMLVLSLVLFGLTLYLRSGELLAIFFVLWLVAISDAAVIAGRLLKQQQVSPWAWF